MIIRLADPADPLVRPLIETHLAHSQTAAPQASDHSIDVQALGAPDIRFWAAFDGPDAIGCCALKPLPDGTSEIKSVHVAAAARRRGVAQALMQHLITQARQDNIAELVLETGSNDEYAAARGLYENLGFLTCPPIFGYVADPNSIFMRLPLDPDR